MPTRNFAAEAIAPGIVSVSWSGLLGSPVDDGLPYERPERSDRSVHVVGTFGTGGTIVLEGSNEPTPTNWRTLTDPLGNALSFTATNLEQVVEVTRWVRPRVTGGDGTTNLTVHMIFAGGRL
jgi:hypothetical protein